MEITILILEYIKADGYHSTAIVISAITCIYRTLIISI